MDLLARVFDHGIEVRRPSEVDDPHGWLEIIDQRPPLQEGQRHVGPVYVLADDAQSVRAVYEVESVPAMTPREMARDAIAKASTVAQLRSALLTWIDGTA